MSRDNYFNERRQGSILAYRTRQVEVQEIVCNLGRSRTCFKYLDDPIVDTMRKLRKLNSFNEYQIEKFIIIFE